MNKHLDEQSGATLLELMAVLCIVAIMTAISLPLLREQVAAQEIDSIARLFITQAHFARQQALHLGEAVLISPMSIDGLIKNSSESWERGWFIQSGCLTKSSNSNCIPKYWFSQSAIGPIYFKGGGKQFQYPHSGKKGILFNAAGAAKTGQGGFVANRLILGHRGAPKLERQLILGSGGRWRICDPARDAKRCH